VTELDARRAGSGACDGEQVAEEIAAVLTLTGGCAGSLLDLSRDLQRLPQTQGLLAAGVIDRSRAAVIADQLAVLSDADAAAVEDRVARRAGGLTTGQLRAVSPWPTAAMTGKRRPPRPRTSAVTKAG
jgi:hypothetical protein